jgi:hypothetical protein
MAVTTTKQVPPMRRLSGWLAIATVAVAMLGGSAWAWAHAPADVVLATRYGTTEGPSFDASPTQSVLLPFFCHW